MGSLFKFLKTLVHIYETVSPALSHGKKSLVQDELAKVFGNVRDENLSL